VPPASVCCLWCGCGHPSPSLQSRASTCRACADLLVRWKESKDFKKEWKREIMDNKKDPYDSFHSCGPCSLQSLSSSSRRPRSRSPGSSAARLWLQPTTCKHYWSKERRKWWIENENEWKKYGKRLRDIRPSCRWLPRNRTLPRAPLGPSSSRQCALEVSQKQYTPQIIEKSIKNKTNSGNQTKQTITYSSATSSWSPLPPLAPLSCDTPLGPIRAFSSNKWERKLFVE
jgi:hypothetical protein